MTNDKENYDKGMQIRRAVLGDEHVDTVNASINPFNKDFQEFITRYAWGEIWSRPRLDRKMRSLITLAMLVPLNREKEFRMHVKAAINNGVEVGELKELLLHAGIYCGLPAANAAIQAAEEVLQELDIPFEKERNNPS